MHVHCHEVTPPSRANAHCRYAGHIDHTIHGRVARLLADAELADDVAISVRVAPLEIVQEAATFADKHQQASPRAMVLLVRFEMLGELGDALTQDRNLDFRAAGVRVMRTELLNYVCLSCGCQHCLGVLLIV